jgi:fructosamine-3-kinase
MIPGAVRDWLQKQGSGEVISWQAVGGGCINHGMVLHTRTGESFFLKVNTATPANMFPCEAEGLQALRVTGGPTVPEPYLYGSDFLLMEDLAPTQKQGNYWQAFGKALATLHNHTGRDFGFPTDNYIGSTPQPNPWTRDGFDFFAQERLLFLTNTATLKGLLDRTTSDRLASLAARLRSLVPEQPPSLIHGDLWSGNAMTDSRGSPAIIDPAAHYGWAEADLAMTSLFGSFPSQFYHAYESVRPLEPDYPQRFPIYNLYHLLNHLVLFGRGYLDQIKSILNRYT